MPIDLMKPVLDAISRGNANGEEQEQERRSLEQGAGGALERAPETGDALKSPAREDSER
jgi:hypothetical protein